MRQDGVVRRPWLRWAIVVAAQQVGPHHDHPRQQQQRRRARIRLVWMAWGREQHIMLLLSEFCDDRAG